MPFLGKSLYPWLEIVIHAKIYLKYSNTAYTYTMHDNNKYSNVRCGRYFSIDYWQFTEFVCRCLYGS